MLEAGSLKGGFIYAADGGPQLEGAAGGHGKRVGDGEAARGHAAEAAHLRLVQHRLHACRLRGNKCFKAMACNKAPV